MVNRMWKPGRNLVPWTWNLEPGPWNLGGTFSLVHFLLSANLSPLSAFLAGSGLDLNYLSHMVGDVRWGATLSHIKPSMLKCISSCLPTTSLPPVCIPEKRLSTARCGSISQVAGSGPPDREKGFVSHLHHLPWTVETFPVNLALGAVWAMAACMLKRSNSEVLEFTAHLTL